jgi:hypothetical protein
MSDSEQQSWWRRFVDPVANAEAEQRMWTPLARTLLLAISGLVLLGVLLDWLLR